MRRNIAIGLLLLASFGCSSGSDSDFKNLSYDVTADATLNQVVQDISALSAVNFSIDPVLQAKLDAEPVDLPILLGLNIGQVLTLLQDSMPPDSSYLYKEVAGGGILLIPRYQQAEDLSGADPVTIVEFDTSGLGLRNLISDPVFEEECGGDDILGLLGDGGPFDIITEVISDPGGHAGFIGDFPPSVDLAIAGNQLTVTGMAPWVTVTGAIHNDGTFTCFGSGTVAGFPNVTVNFDGQALPEGLSGTLTVGAGGELPGGAPAVYAISH